MMTKKKILIGSIFAALLMVSVPIISALQTASVATSTTTTSVQTSNPTDTTNTQIQSINLAVVRTNVNKILSINPKTATPEQMEDGIETAIYLLNYLGYKAQATELYLELQGIINRLIICPLVQGLVMACVALIDVFGFLSGIFSVAGNENAANTLIGLSASVMVFFLGLTAWYVLNCYKAAAAGCSECEAATGSITPITSN